MIVNRDNVPGAARFQRAHAPVHSAVHPAARPDHDNELAGSVARHSPVNPITPTLLELWPSSLEKILSRSVVSLVTVARRIIPTLNLCPDLVGACSSPAIRDGYTHGATEDPLINSGASRAILIVPPPRIIPVRGTARPIKTRDGRPPILSASSASIRKFFLLRTARSAQSARLSPPYAAINRFEFIARSSATFHVNPRLAIRKPSTHR